MINIVNITNAFNLHLISVCMHLCRNAQRQIITLSHVISIKKWCPSWYHRHSKLRSLECLWWYIHVHGHGGSTETFESVYISAQSSILCFDKMAAVKS